MKYVFSALVLLLFVNASKPHKTTFAPDNRPDHELTNRISQSFKIGNPRMLAGCLNQEIELLIDSEKIDFRKISAEQAEQIFKSFFQRNPPLSFKYVYQGESDSNLRYSVANYRSRNKDFTVYMLVKKSADRKYVIDTIQFRES